MAVLGLWYCAWSFSSCYEQELLSSCCAWAYCSGFSCCGAWTLCELQLLQHAGSVGEAPGLQSTGSIAMVQGLSCPAAFGVFLDQGTNPCLLHWRADSSPLSHQGSPKTSLKKQSLKKKNKKKQSFKKNCQKAAKVTLVF